MNSRKNTSERTLPAWVWLFTGIVTGLFLAFLYYLAGVPRQTMAPESANSTEAQHSSEQRRYDFYTKLRDRDNLAPDTQPRPLGERFKQRRLIQSGSFKNSKDADKRRAELLLLGLDVYTEKAQLANGSVYHRVMVGSLNTAEELADARQLLDANQIEHIVRTLPAEH